MSHPEQRALLRALGERATVLNESLESIDYGRN
jgi:hypothetical protein